MLVTYFSTALGLTFRVCHDAGVGAALGHQPQHLLLARGEAVHRVVAAADHQLGDDLGVQRGAAGGDPAHRVEEVADVRDPVLEQVADRAGGLRQQVGGVALLHVLGQHQKRHVRVLAPDDQRCRMPSSVCVGGIRTSSTARSG